MIQFRSTYDLCLHLESPENAQFSDINNIEIRKAAMFRCFTTDKIVKSTMHMKMYEFKTVVYYVGYVPRIV